MSDASMIIAILGQLGSALPILLACFIGLIFIKIRSLGKKTKIFAVIGLLLLIIEAIVGFAFRLTLNTQILSGFHLANGMIGSLFDLYTVFSVLTYTAGVIFLIIAICSKDSASNKKDAIPNPYQT